MVGSIQFQVESFGFLTARCFTMDGHVVITRIPKDDEAKVQSIVTDVVNAASRCTTAYIASVLPSYGFAVKESSPIPIFEYKLNIAVTPAFSAVVEDGEPDTDPEGHGTGSTEQAPTEEPKGGSEEPKVEAEEPKGEDSSTEEPATEESKTEESATEEPEPDKTEEE